MKLIFILCTAVLLNVNAATSFAQKINISVKNAPIERVFEEITKQSGYNFLYNTQMLEDARPLTLSVKNASLESILKLCFKDQDLSYTLAANTVVVKKKLEAKALSLSLGQNKMAVPTIPEAAEMQRAVTGIATDQLTNDPLAGVTIKVKNGSATAVTDAAGKFSINAKASDILVATYLGYENTENTVGASLRVDFALKKSLNNLDEVVVVGYGTQAKRDVSGAITTVSSRQIMERSPINVYEALQGQSPGLQVSQASGAPGAASSVIIRGIGSFGTNQTPLYIVDGAQGVSIDAINPNDIQSIDILKDAASTSIYGTRGANGVIIITTKRGKDGQPEINANLVQSYGTLSHKIASSNADLRRLYDQKLGQATIPTDSLNPGVNADVDALDAVTRVAKNTNASVSLSGGSGGARGIRYFGSFNYVSDESIILNSWRKTGRFRMNVEYSPSNKLTFTSNLNFGLNNGNTVLESSTLNEAYARNPTYALYLLDGSLTGTINGRQNPVAWALYNINTSKNYSATLYNKADYNFTKDLKWTTDATLNYNTSHIVQFVPNRLSGAGVPVNNGSDESRVGTSWIVQSYLNYSKTLGTDHTISAMVGASAEKRFNSNFKLTGQTYVTDAVLTLNSAQAYGTPTNGENASSAVGSWARVNYSFKRRYTAQASVRADASSRFGPENRWGYFPSGGVSWFFSEEPFMSGLNKVIASGKFRATYGLTGNDQALGSYDAIQTYTFGTNFYNGVSGVVLNGTYGNPTLSWEVNKALNLGTDISLLKGRANVTFDYYDRITSKLLYSSPLPVESGFGSLSVNVGSMQNIGYEFTVGGTPVRTKNFDWNIQTNLAFNRQKVLTLANHTVVYANVNRNYTQEGHPLGDFIGWRQLGVFAYDQSNAFDTNWNRLTPIFNGTTFTGYTLNGQPYTGTVNKKKSNGVIAVGGDVDWEDLDKNGIIDDNDRSILGNAQPKYTLGLSNNFNYKAFNLAVIFYASMGGKIYNSISLTQSDYHETGVTPRPYIILNAWDKQGDITDVPDAKLGSAIGNVRPINSRYIEDASYVRLRNVKLTYSLPARLATYIGARRVNVSASGNNLLTWSKYIGFDPEFQYNDPFNMGIESTSRVPRKNEWLFGLNVNF